ncbi:4-alpha-glucanotransferase [Mangrovibacterium marinum]|uniref:4-alpha-glucanotransferase n=1 Tax=Mangrovibacterium marinum TaxID=1639118 RepID=A0A2T5BX16_9BACT|nr:4-alpha-glucanotransferase [Mangrovibacterium marinum]PTN04332.1 4-alpha-glucanotransferase [Mangrovibacterium marinum]
MKLIFKLHYNTTPGQQLFLSGSAEALGEWQTEQAIPLYSIGNGFWEIAIDCPASTKRLEYKYFMLDTGGRLHWEWGNNHFIDLNKYHHPLLELADQWKNPSPAEKVFYSDTFSGVIMKPGKNKAAVNWIEKEKILQFRISVPRINGNYKLCMLGNQEVMGNWNESQPLLMEFGDDFPVWTVQVDAENLKFPVHYKYGIWDLQAGKLKTVEEGFDRELNALTSQGESFAFIKTDNNFRYPLGNWKGAGVAVPVFSLRSRTSFGVGDFGDLFKLIDWAKSVGLKMVQILPVNETVASHNWLDSYPYKSISVMALHPIYLNLEKMGQLNNLRVQEEFTTHGARLNLETHVDYPEVHRLKSRYYKLIFDQDGEKLFNSSSFKKFFAANKDWLVPYAAFVYLRDQFKTPDFRQWGDFRRYDRYKIEALSEPGAPSRDDVVVHYFIQYHLDKQLKEATSHARKNGLILKGDIPIGISPNSVEAWMEPHLFNLDAQAGAPPDDFAIKGQNWGFPTYNWEEMARDNYAWWIRRMQKMAEYFDTYRIDHILGFFRIWEVPGDAVEALLGHFNPALPLTADEIQQFGVQFDYERFTQPYIRYHLLVEQFGEQTESVIQQYLEDLGDQKYRLKEEFNTQQKINAHFLNGIEEEQLEIDKLRLRNGLFDLVANVILVSTGHNQWHPRIAMTQTSSFAELDFWSQERLRTLYDHYFYRRHEDFWYQKGMEKLPAITSVGNLLVCGEDLGMIPACVPKAMTELNILSLEIQRMPKDPKKQFAHPADAPYLSVCTTSTHDMSTIRGWWEEDHELSQLFYNQELGNWGTAPYFAEPDICRQIITQHLHSPAIWTTFPIQDLLAMDGQLRWDKTQEEQINLPANVRHKWRYRMKQSIEELKQAQHFNDLLKDLLNASGRNSDY